MRLVKAIALSILLSLFLISCGGTGDDPATPVDTGQDAGAWGSDSDVEIESDAENDSDLEDTGAAGSDRDVGFENDAGSDDAELDDDDVICECDEETFCCDGCSPINVGEECDDDNLPCTDNFCNAEGECQRTVLDGWCLTGDGTAEAPWQCADTATDPANCGDCDHICPQGAVCIAGDCFTEVTGLTVEPETLSLDVGDQQTLTAAITPGNASDQRVAWASDDETIATVDEDGTVTAVEQGEANIVVTTVDGGYSASVLVTVVMPVTDVTLTPESLTLILGETEHLLVTIIPAEATVQNVGWESADPGVATVDEDGLVEGVGLGETIITVRTEDGGHTASIEVTVTPVPAGYELIPAGTFTMGSPESELGRDDDETQHVVTITRPFLMQATQVTQGEWEALMGNNPSSYKSGSNYPVEMVNWHKTLAYANALSEFEGLSQCFDCTVSGEEITCDLKVEYAKPQDCSGYRLPTEAEWEYAARAGSTTAFHTGDITDKQTCPNMDRAGWYYYNSGNKTHPVGGKEPNDWGLYDMHGNVWEWVWDYYGDYESGPAIDPYGPSTGGRRVRRGGPWGGNARGCRAGSRGNLWPDNRYNSLGFRLVRSL